MADQSEPPVIVPVGSVRRQLRQELDRMANPRPVLLVGSVPLESSSAVFAAAGASIGSVAKRIPDGETGVRKDWIGWQGAIMAQATGLTRGGVRPLQGGYEFQLYRLSGEPADVDFGSLGYADVALESYGAFVRAREQGIIPAGTRFQVSLPTPLAVVLSFFEPEAVEAAWPLYEAAMLGELSRIVGGIPHDDLAVQWDIAAEICFVLEVPEMAALLPMDVLVAAIARVGNQVPPEVELGLHLCYGDPGHKHVVEPKDTALMVEFANNLFAAIDRPVAWVHMPVPRGRDDAEYFAPLSDLHRPDGTELYLGLVHMTDGLDGAKRRLSAARGVVDDFGVATECGFGRRPPDTVPALLELHAAVAAQG
jgi:hypothetical protein